MFYTEEIVKTVVLLYFDGRDLQTIAAITGMNLDDIDNILDNILI